MRNDDEFYAYVLEKYRIKKQKGLSKKTMAASAAGNYQYEQTRPALNRKRAAAYVTAAVALIAGLGVCVYVFNPFQVIGPDVSSSTESSNPVNPPIYNRFEHLLDPVTATYNGQTITMGYLLKSDMKIDNTVSSSFSQGYAVICSIDSGRDGFCFVDEKGNILGDTIYKMAYSFGKDGRALVQKDDESWAYIDTTGKEVGEGDPTALSDGDTDIYSENDRFGVKDRDGNKLTEPIFSFIQGLSLPQNYAVLAGENEKKVLINGKGDILATLPYYTGGIRPLGNNRIACAYSGVNGEYIYQLMDNTGKVLNAAYYTNIGGFENGLAPITQEGKVGLIDEKGTVIIPPALPLDDADGISLGLSEDKFIGSVDGKLVILGINREPAAGNQGNTILPAPVTGTYNGQTITMGYRTLTNHAWIFDNLTPTAFQNGYAMVYDFTREYDDGIISERGTYMDKDGLMLTQPQYKYMQPFNDEGRAVAQKIDGSWVYVDTSGTETPADEDAWNNWPSSVHGSPAPVEPEGCVGAWMYADEVIVASYGEGKFCEYRLLFDIEGNLLNDMKFDRVGDFYQGLAAVLVDGKMGVVDTKGNLVIEPSLDAMCWGNLPAYEDLIIVDYNGKAAIIEITRTDAANNRQ